MEGEGVQNSHNLPPTYQVYYQLHQSFQNVEVPLFPLRAEPGGQVSPEGGCEMKKSMLERMREGALALPTCGYVRGKEIDRGEMGAGSSVPRGPLSKQKAQRGETMLDSLKRS